MGVVRLIRASCVAADANVRVAACCSTALIADANGRLVIDSRATLFAAVYARPCDAPTAAFHAGANFHPVTCSSTALFADADMLMCALRRVISRS